MVQVYRQSHSMSTLLDRSRLYLSVVVSMCPGFESVGRKRQEDIRFERETSLWPSELTIASAGYRKQDQKERRSRNGWGGVRL